MNLSRRRSDVAAAGQVYVTNQGEVVEQGTHDELRARHGRYQRLFAAQAFGY
jgi:ABC-type multidrug transport system fused ATPase/permease subunit